MRSLITISSVALQTAGILVVSWLCTVMPAEVRKREALAGVFAAICLSSIFVTTYSAVSPRSRQIAVLRALGGTRLFIANVVLLELTLLIAAGVALGFGMSTATIVYLAHRTHLSATIPHSGTMIVPLVAGSVGFFGASSRTVQILSKFSTYLARGSR